METPIEQEKSKRREDPQSTGDRLRALGDYVMDECGPVLLRLPRLPEGFNVMSPWLNDFHASAPAAAVREPSESGAE